MFNNYCSDSGFCVTTQLLSSCIPGSCAHTHNHRHNTEPLEHFHYSNNISHLYIDLTNFDLFLSKNPNALLLGHTEKLCFCTWIIFSHIRLDFKIYITANGGYSVSCDIEVAGRWVGMASVSFCPT